MDCVLGHSSADYGQQQCWQKEKGRKKKEKLPISKFKRLGVRNNSAAAAPIDETNQINPVAGGSPGRKVHYSLPISLSGFKSSRPQHAVAAAIPQSLPGSAERALLLACQQLKTARAPCNIIGLIDPRTSSQTTSCKTHKQDKLQTKCNGSSQGKRGTYS